MKSNRPLIRRTFLQERFDILIKKQRNGHATFNDLTELDDIVNRDPAIRESILEEMQGIDKTPQDPGKPEIINIEPVVKPLSLLEQLKAFVNRLFITETPDFTTALLN
jgi:hypothetical protein